MLYLAQNLSRVATFIYFALVDTRKLQLHHDVWDQSLELQVAAKNMRVAAQSEAELHDVVVLVGHWHAIGPP